MKKKPRFAPSGAIIVILVVVIVIKYQDYETDFLISLLKDPD